MNIEWENQSFEELECQLMSQGTDMDNVYVFLKDGTGEWFAWFRDSYRCGSIVFYERLAHIVNPITGVEEVYRDWSTPLSYCRGCGKPRTRMNIYSGWVFGRRRNGRQDCFCPECKTRSDIMVACDECGERHPIFELNAVNQSSDGETRALLCDDCKSEYGFACERCGATITSEGAHDTTNDGEVCRYCRDNYYSECEHCGGVYLAEEMTCADDGYYYCHSCHEELNPDDEDDDDESTPYGVYEYHDWDGGYTPKGVDKKDDSYYMGVELEVDRGVFEYDDYCDFEGDIHFERDGSLSNSGVECITQPRTLRYHLECLKWEALCNAFKNAGFKSHNTSTCGLHVHIARAALKKSTIVKMDVFINRNGRFFGAIGRRNSFYCGDFNSCKRARAIKGLSYGDEHKNKFYSGVISKGYWDNEKYQAVNTGHGKTVELRFMRGTLKPETILGTLELIHGLPRFLDNVPWSKLYEPTLVEEFIQFLYEERKKYPHVMGMMKELLDRDGTTSDYKSYLDIINTKKERN